MLIVEFDPAGDRLVDADRTVIVGLAADAEADVRALLPLADPLHYSFAPPLPYWQRPVTTPQRRGRTGSPGWSTRGGEPPPWQPRS